MCTAMPVARNAGQTVFCGGGGGGHRRWRSWEWVGAQEQAYRLGMGVTTRGFAWARPGRGGRVGMGVAE